MYFTKSFHKISGYFLRNSSLSFVLVRYATTASVVVEMFIFARLLGPQAFGEYALAVQIVGFLLLIGAGSGAGYVYAYYKEGERNIDNVYMLGSLVQYLIGVLALGVASCFSASYLIISSLLLCIQIPYFITEPMLRVRNQFTLSAVGRASGSMATIFLTMSVLPFSIDKQSPLYFQFNLKNAFMLMLVGNSLGYLAYYYTVCKSAHIKFDSRIFVFRNISHTLKIYWKSIILPSGAYVLSSILFVTFTYVDRMFLEAYYPKDNLSVYSLSLQIAQSVSILLSSLSVISGVRIGESQSENSSKLIHVANRQLKTSSCFGLGAFVLAVFGAWILNSTIYSDYKNLLLVTSIFSFSYLTYGVLGSIMMFLFFEKKFRQISLMYAIMVIVSFVGNLLAVKYKLEYTWPLLCSASALIFTNIGLLVFYRKISQRYLVLENTAT